MPEGERNNVDETQEFSRQPVSKLFCWSALRVLLSPGLARPYRSASQSSPAKLCHKPGTIWEHYAAPALYKDVFYKVSPCAGQRPSGLTTSFPPLPRNPAGFDPISSACWVFLCYFILLSPNAFPFPSLRCSTFWDA